MFAECLWVLYKCQLICQLIDGLISRHVSTTLNAALRNKGPHMERESETAFQKVDHCSKSSVFLVFFWFPSVLTWFCPFIVKLGIRHSFFRNCWNTDGLFLNLLSGSVFWSLLLKPVCICLCHIARLVMRLESAPLIRNNVLKWEKQLFGCELCYFYCFTQYTHWIQAVHKGALNDDTFRSFQLDLNNLTEEAEVKESFVSLTSETKLKLKRDDTFNCLLCFVN